MGAHQLDVGMIATGLMISITPIILISPFSPDFKPLKPPPPGFP
jgi:hypothetical protein